MNSTYMKKVFENLLGVIAVPLVLALMISVSFGIFTYIGVPLTPILSLIIALTPIWLPFTLFYLTYERWTEFVQTKFVVYNGRTTLRIKLPQDVFKSPAAMESVLTQIFNPQSIDNYWQSWIDGKHPLTNTLELVSIGGDVRLYMNVPTKKIRNAVESQLYAQYPGIEVIEETIDYTAEITWDPNKWEYMAFHMGKKKDEIFPIKTYIDYGLDKMPKEEEKFDPMSPMLEQLSAVKPHERVWIQILITPHIARTFKNAAISPNDTWEKKVTAEIDKMLGRDSATKAGPGEFVQENRLTTGERDKIAAMERNAGKYAYDTGIRWIYIAEKGKFSGDIIGPVNRSFAQYDVIGRNAIGVRWRTDFDYNWFSDFFGNRKVRMKKQELYDYKIRYYERRDYKGRADTTKVFSVEELATIFHIPGRVVGTPGVGRVPSTRREAPPNLPTGDLPI